jgi:hypothetical protein
MYGIFFLIYFIIRLAMHFSHMTKFYRNERKIICKNLGGGDNRRFKITSENFPKIDRTKHTNLFRAVFILSLTVWSTIYIQLINSSSSHSGIFTVRCSFCNSQREYYGCITKNKIVIIFREIMFVLTTYGTNTHSRTHTLLRTHTHERTYAHTHTLTYIHSRIHSH